MPDVSRSNTLVASAPRGMRPLRPLTALFEFAVGSHRRASPPPRRWQMEVRPFGNRVTNIEPGVILTPMWGKLPAVPEMSDYGQGLARMSRLFVAQMEGGTSPDVAEAIYRAATEDGPLYVPLGNDADVVAMARSRATPDEWISIYAEPDEQRFVDRFTQLQR